MRTENPLSPLGEGQGEGLFGKVLAEFARISTLQKFYRHFPTSDAVYARRYAGFGRHRQNLREHLLSSEL
jgi:hypothetical protein